MNITSPLAEQYRRQDTMRPSHTLPATSQLEDQAHFTLRFNTALRGQNLSPNYMVLGSTAEGLHAGLEQHHTFRDYWLLCVYAAGESDPNQLANAALLCPCDGDELTVFQTNSLCEALDRLRSYVDRRLDDEVMPRIFVVCGGGNLGTFQGLRQVCQTAFSPPSSMSNAVEPSQMPSRGRLVTDNIPIVTHVLGLDCLTPTAMKMTASLSLGGPGGYKELFTLSSYAVDPLLPYAVAVIQGEALFSSSSENNATLDQWLRFLGNFSVVSDSYTNLLQSLAGLFEWCCLEIERGDSEPSRIYQYRAANCGDDIFLSMPRVDHHLSEIVERRSHRLSGFRTAFLRNLYHLRV